MSLDDLRMLRVVELDPVAAFRGEEIAFTGDDVPFDPNVIGLLDIDAEGNVTEHVVANHRTVRTWLHPDARMFRLDVTARIANDEPLDRDIRGNDFDHMPLKTAVDNCPATSGTQLQRFGDTQWPPIDARCHTDHASRRGLFQCLL